MQMIRSLEKTDKNGTLQLRIALGKPDAEYEIVVIVQPKLAAVETATSEQRGWPPGYFENTYGSIDDDTFFRHPQGELPKPVEFD
jgi:hypothetical protein